MVTIKLTDEQAEMLNDLLSLDLEEIGFDDEEIELLDKVGAELTKAIYESC